jgi:hypothetical protein
MAIDWKNTKSEPSGVNWTAVARNYGYDFRTTVQENKLKRLQKMFDDNVAKSAQFNEEYKKRSRNPLVAAAKFKDVMVNEAKGSVRMGQDIANKDWNSTNIGTNIVDIAKKSNRAKYGLTTAILASPFTAPAEMLGVADKAGRSLMAEGIIKNNKVTDPKEIARIRKDMTGKEEFAPPTTKETLGTTAMAMAEVLGASKIMKGIDTVSDIAKAGKVVDTASDVNKTFNIIKQLKKAKTASELTAATKLGAKQIMYNMAKQGGQAAGIGILGAGGQAAADNASNQDVAKSALIGGGFGTVLGVGGSGIGSIMTNKVANKAASTADELTTVIKQTQDIISNTKNSKRVAKSLVDAGYIEQAKLVLSGQMTPEQTAQLAKVIHSDTRLVNLINPDAQLALPSPTTQGVLAGTDIEAGFKPGRVTYKDGTPGFVMTDDVPVKGGQIDKPIYQNAPAPAKKSYPEYDDNIKESFWHKRVDGDTKLSDTRVLSTDEIFKNGMNQGDVDASKVSPYIKKIKAGEPIEPIVVSVKNIDEVIYDGATPEFKIADGHHRIVAAAEAGYKDVPVKIVYGNEDVAGYGAKEISTSDLDKIVNGLGKTPEAKVDVPVKGGQIDELAEEITKSKNYRQFAESIGNKNITEVGDNYVLYKGRGGDLDITSRYNTGDAYQYLRDVADGKAKMPEGTTSFSPSYRKASDYASYSDDGFGEKDVTAYYVKKSDIMPSSEYEKLLDTKKMYNPNSWRNKDNGIVDEIKRMGYKGVNTKTSVYDTGEVVLFDKNIAKDIYKGESISSVVKGGVDKGSVLYRGEPPLVRPKDGVIYSGGIPDGNGGVTNVLGDAVYLSKDKNVAGKFATGGGKVTEHVIKLKKPLILDSDSAFDNIKFEIYGKTGKFPDPLDPNVQLGGGDVKATANSLQKAIRDLGYDGVEVRLDSGKRVDNLTKYFEDNQTIVFDKNLLSQPKSASPSVGGVDAKPILPGQKGVISGPAGKVETSQKIIPTSKITVQDRLTADLRQQYGTASVPSFKMETSNPAKEIADKVDSFYKMNIDPKNPVVIDGLQKEVENMVEAATLHQSKFMAILDKYPIIKNINRIGSQRNVVLRNSGIKELNDVAARNDVYSIYRGKFMAEAEPLAKKLTKMSATDQAKIVKTILEAPDRTKLTGVAREVTDLLDKRREVMVNMGLDIGNIENYFPRRLNPKYKTEAQRYIRNEILDKLTVAKTTGKTDVLKSYGLDMNSTAEEMRIVASKKSGVQLSTLDFARQNNVKKSGVEFARGVELPDKFYLKPELTLADWNKDTADRISSAMVFGKKDEKIQLTVDAIDNRVKEGLLSEHDAKYYKEFVQNLVHNERFGTDQIKNQAVHKFLKFGRGYQMFSKLGISSITNAGQFQNKANIFGYTKSAKAYVTVNKNIQKYLAKSRDYGINLTPVLDDLMSNIYEGGNRNWAVTGAANMLTWNGFKGVETQHRLADIVLAEEFLPKWAEKAAKGNKTAMRNLERSGINPDTIKGGVLSKEQMNLGVKGIVSRIDFFVDPKDLQQFATKTELGQTFSQLGKFGLKQAKHVKDEIIKEAAHGNLAPLARWAIGGQVVGATVINTKNLITGSDRETTLADAYNAAIEGDFSKAGSYWWENTRAVGGFGFLADKVEGLKYAKNPTDAAIRSFPMGSSAADLLMAAGISYEAIVNKEVSFSDRDKLIKTGLKNIPMGNVISGNLQRTGVIKKYDPAEGQAYDLYSKLGLGTMPNRTDAQDLGNKLKNKENLSQTDMVKTLVNKLYDSKGKEKPVAPKEKDKLLKFLSDNGIDPKIVQKQNSITSKKESADRARLKKKMSKQEQSIATSYGSMKTADRYLRSIGDSIDNHPLLKQRYESLGYDSNYLMWGSE